MLLIWVKAFHIIAVICWFAALFYLPRLFVYHSMSDDEISIERFKIMERKLYKGICTPSMIATLTLGAWMVWLNPAYLALGWFQLKLVFVACILYYHYLCGTHVQNFASNQNNKSHKYFRVFNEAPVLALIPIVILATVKPF